MWLVCVYVCMVGGERAPGGEHAAVEDLLAPQARDGGRPPGMDACMHGGIYLSVYLSIFLSIYLPI